MCPYGKFGVVRMLAKDRVALLSCRRQDHKVESGLHQYHLRQAIAPPALLSVLNYHNIY